MKRDDESQTEYTVRLIKIEAWQEGHDEACGWKAGCKVHVNPHA